MKRYFYPSLLFAFVTMALFAGSSRLYAQGAQGKPYEGQVSYQRSVLTGTMIDLPYAPDIVESSIRDYMARKGWKSSSNKGYKVYKNMRLDDTAASPTDLHIKVERKSSRDKSSSILTMLAVPPGEDPAMATGRDEVALRRSSALLEKLLPVIEAGDLEDRIKTQEDDTKKAEKKLGNLHDDQADLEKKIRNTQADLVKNKDDQTKETQFISSASQNDAAAMKKSQKKLDKLSDDQMSLQKKLGRYQSDLEQNKKSQDFQQKVTTEQQVSLDSLRAKRKH